MSPPRAIYLLAIYMVMNLPFSAFAVADESILLHCDTLPELAGNRRTSPSGPVPDATKDECFYWGGSTPQISIYYSPQTNPASRPYGSEAGVENPVLAAIWSAARHSLEVYQANNFLFRGQQPPIRIWFLRPPGPPGVPGDANIQDSSSPCGINLYMQGVAESTLEFVQQMTAHEVFHCIQFSQLNGGYDPDGKWWMEGSATWASSLVYPQYNFEYGSTTSFHQHQLLFDQCDPEHAGHCDESVGEYGTALFFQAMANQKGNSAVFGLLRRMPAYFGPGLGEVESQHEALSSAPGMDVIFEKFAQDYMDQQIKDANGGEYMAQPEPITSGTFEIDHAQDITVQAAPLMIYAYRLTFVKGKTYEIDGLQNTERFRFSYHRDDGVWESGDRSGPLKVAPGCQNDQALTLLITSAEDVHVSRLFDLHVRVLSDDAQVCNQCDCAEAVPVCLVGNWISKHAPQLDLFVEALPGVSKKGRDAATFETGSVEIERADLTLDMTESGEFSHTTLVDYTGEGRVEGNLIGMSGSINSKTSGQACLTTEGQLCMHYTGRSLPTKMIFSMQGMSFPMPIPGREHKGNIALPFSCSPDNLTLEFKLPELSIELPIQYHR